ncbi:hypothetical protein CEUSTIGMA_g11854.t1 [Chlamydomonas eustigma]|uniref:Reverse transcriptase Ty1/copia-type domain-containing protein n=1 Tax=Chlamydomonas eustigma TaxID=1157962 RepID=A0A250XMX4_9CHLO|nr:hypothetical protein CEUSTIGMA_g11854.t1 [Chlamydomonas eustigma]|eukprot:GAX84434.1 hypothetical protein CEUSTIGMA_g11854.t1 [Chlamydomonas eustigma]
MTHGAVSKLESVISFLATTATRNLVDVKTTFLNAELTEDIFIIRFPKEVDGGTKVYRLRKALYRLKQASTAWQLSTEDGDLLDDKDRTKYREMTGCLMYVCRGTRPDIAYSVGVLARYIKKPKTLHLKAAMDILKCLAATKLMGIEYGGQRDTFVGYSDNDLGGCRDNSRSTMDLQWGGNVLEKQTATHHCRLIIM